MTDTRRGGSRHPHESGDRPPFGNGIDRPPCRNGIDGAAERRRVPAFAGTTARFLCLAGLVVAAGCRHTDRPDAYGNFEATEVVVSAQTGGPLLWFSPDEGDRVAAGALVGVVDTTQLALERAQILAQREATGARGTEVVQQTGALEVQREIARRSYERTKRLFDQQAATAQQLDQAERDYRVLGEQIQALRAQRRSVGHETESTEARVALLRDRIARSRITSPVSGTVLVTYARAGELVQPGQPLFRVANLDTLVLRAYVGEPQLASVKLGQRVEVRLDRGDGNLLTLPGVVSWIAARAEFTPTPVQTRDERTDLVYAVKVRVANPNGALKIGMPADVRLTAPSPAPARS